MISIAETSPRVKLLKKMNDFRNAVIKDCDWTADGQMRIQGNLIKYISIAQMKAALAPLYAQYGLEFDADMPTAPIYNADSRQWCVGVKFSVTDIETGEEKSNTIWSAASGEKGMAVAESYSLKMYYSLKYNLADGIDPEKDNTVSSSYVPKTEKEKEEVISKIQEKAVKPAPVVEKPAPKPVEKPVAKPAPADAKPITGMQGRAIVNLISQYEDKLSRGEITEERYKEIRAAADACRTSDLAREFITKYRV